jgi:hypothetical protein
MKPSLGFGAPSAESWNFPSKNVNCTKDLDQILVEQQKTEVCSKTAAICWEINSHKLILLLI